MAIWFVFCSPAAMTYTSPVTMTYTKEIEGRDKERRGEEREEAA